MKVTLAVLNGILVAAYPLAVYVGLTRFSARGVGLLLLGLLLPGLLFKLRLSSLARGGTTRFDARREDVLVVLRLPLSIAVLLGLAAILNDARFVFALPILINAALFVQFFASLRGTPLVERFARMQSTTLSREQVAYCRTVTKVWCAFFVVNASLSGALAVWAPLAWWTLYNGLVAYVLMGVLGASEYVVRKFRFREYGSGLHDRLLARVFPPRSEVHS